MNYSVPYCRMTSYPCRLRMQQIGRMHFWIFCHSLVTNSEGKWSFLQWIQFGASENHSCARSTTEGLPLTSKVICSRVCLRIFGALTTAMSWQRALAELVPSLDDKHHNSLLQVAMRLENPAHRGELLLVLLPVA